MGRERLYHVAAWMLILLLGGVFTVLFFRYFFGLLFPFLIAWLVSYPVFTLSQKLSERLKISRRICAAMLFLLLLALTVLLLAVGINRLLHETRDLLLRMIERYGSVEEMVGTWLANLEQTIQSIPFLRQDGRNDAVMEGKWYGMLYDLISSAITAVVGVIPSVAGQILQMLPSIVFGIVITVIAGFYFSMDREEISRSVISMLPENVRQSTPRWRQRSKRVSWQYLKAYLILMLITFSILLVGFLVLKIPYALLLALLSAIVDMLPVLGVGTVLLPWAALLLLQKNYYLGFALLILYAICTLTRQVAEPKLIGKSLGLHPVLTLLATYVGFQLFGVIGMLLSPFLALLARSVFLQFSDGGRKGD